MSHFQIALLRGINVGKSKRVAMADLRKLFEGLGYGNVSTLLNSGNVVFTTSRAAAGNAGAKIENAIAEVIGVKCRVIVISAVELATAIAENPMVELADKHSRLMVGVLAESVDLTKLKLLAKQNWDPEVLAIGTRSLYYWLPGGILDSKLATAIARSLGNGITTRNWATMLKLRELTK